MSVKESISDRPAWAPLLHPTFSLSVLPEGTKTKSQGMTSITMIGVDQRALPLGLKMTEETACLVTVSMASVHFPYCDKQVHKRMQELCPKEVHVVQKLKKDHSRTSSAFHGSVPSQRARQGKKDNT